MTPYGGEETGCGESCGNWFQTRDVKNAEENDRMCQECYDTLGGETSQTFDVLQEVAQGWTLLPTMCKTSINDLILAIESAQRQVEVGDDMVSGLMFADDVVGISGTAEGVQK